MEIFASIGEITVLAVAIGIGYHSGYFLGIPATIVGTLYFYTKWQIISFETQSTLYLTLSFVYFCAFVLGLIIRSVNDWENSRTQAWGA